MNIVLADTNADSEETESTNGLGKTTLLRIIHFCLGSDFRREKALSHPDLAGVTFYLEFRIEETNYQVSRNTASPKLVSVRSEEHTSELQSLLRISYAVFCLKK